MKVRKWKFCPSSVTHLLFVASSVHNFFISTNLGIPVSDNQDLYLTSRENTDTRQINPSVPPSGLPNAVESPIIQLCNDSLAIWSDIIIFMHQLIPAWCSPQKVPGTAAVQIPDATSHALNALQQPPSFVSYMETKQGVIPLLGFGPLNSPEARGAAKKPIPRCIFMVRKPTVCCLMGWGEKSSAKQGQFVCLPHTGCDRSEEYKQILVPLWEKCCTALHSCAVLSCSTASFHRLFSVLQPG